MYGLVNNVLKKMVIEKLGTKTWDDVCQQDVPKDFQNFKQYEDALTGLIAQRLSEITGTEVPKLLEEFGKYWVPNAMKSEYKGIFEVFNSDPISLFKSLDTLHTRLSLTFPNLAPPSFWIANESKNSFELFYRSTRDLPLESFVIGLVIGVFHSFQRECKVVLLTARDKDNPAVFRVTYE